MDYNQNKPLAEQITDKIIEYIKSKGLKAGEKIPNEFELAALLDVGRSTVREAVKILISRNVLEIRRGAGTFVSKKKGLSDDPLGLSFVEDRHSVLMDLLNVRFMLEPEIASMAATNASKEQVKELIKRCDLVENKIREHMDHTAEDIRLHQMIAKCSGNIVVEKLIPVINSSVMMFVDVTSGALRSETIETHREIVEAIRNRDPEGAKAAMNMHLIYNRRRIVQIIKEQKIK